MFTLIVQKSNLAVLACVPTDINLHLHTPISAAQGRSSRGSFTSRQQAGRKVEQAAPSRTELDLSAPVYHQLIHRSRMADNATTPEAKRDLHMGHMELKALLGQEYVVQMKPKAEPTSEDEEVADGLDNKIKTEAQPSSAELKQEEKDFIDQPDYTTVLPKQEPHYDEVLQCSPMLLSLLLRDERLNPNDPASYQEWLTSTTNRFKRSNTRTGTKAALPKRQSETAPSVSSAKKTVESPCMKETVAGASQEMDVGHEALQPPDIQIMSEVKDEKSDEMSSDNPIQIECSVCGRKFPHRFAYDFHRSKYHTIKERPYECADCGRKYPKLIDLKYHLRAHTGERPYQCTDCGKKFYQQSHLNIHERVHTGWKPFKCDKCGKCFTVNAQLKAHQKRDCLQERECPKCGKKFDTDVGLTNHMRSHKRSKTLAELGIKVIPRVKRN